MASIARIAAASALRGAAPRSALNLGLGLGAAAARPWAAASLSKTSAHQLSSFRTLHASRIACYPLPPEKVAELRTHMHDGGHMHVCPYLPAGNDWNKVDLKTRLAPENASDWAAKGIVKFLRFFADLFFFKRYGHRAVVLETVAGVPGMVSAMIHHLKSLRTIQPDTNHIQTLLDEAENERMHLMVYMEVAKPTLFERGLVLAVQAVFSSLYVVLYAFFPKTCHRFVGYLEEEAVVSYTQYLREIDAGNIKNVPAPKIAIDYWRLPKEATLRDVVVATRADEANHRDVNHYIADEILARRAGTEIGARA